MKSKDKLLKKLQEVEEELKEITDLLKEQGMEDRVSAVQELLDRIRFNEIRYEHLEHALQVEREQLEDAFMCGFEASTIKYNGEILESRVEERSDDWHLLQLAKEFYDNRYSK